MDSRKLHRGMQRWPRRGNRYGNRPSRSCGPCKTAVEGGRVVTIRPATVDDLPAVADLTYLAYVESGHVAASDPYVAELTDVQARRANLFVADVEGQVAGSVNIAVPGS